MLMITCLYALKKPLPSSYSNKKEQSVRLFAKMTACISEHDKAGYEHWVKLNNLKEAARTYNYLSEHNLLNYEDFKNHIADVTAAVQATETKIQNLQTKLDTQRLLQKRCDVYRHCRNIVLAEEKALNKNAYRKSIRQNISYMMLLSRNCLSSESKSCHPRKNCKSRFRNLKMN